ncbi:MAG TPA: hypothetical protein DCQ06_12355 [Myxococcales bacterium]|nr:hypothetical protein [Myxococcales bacterium]
MLRVQQDWHPHVQPLLAPLEQLLRSSYRPRQSGKNQKDLVRAHAHALRKLSGRFTDRRSERKAGYMASPESRAAYLLYYVLTGAATIQAALYRSAWRAPKVEGRSLRVLDLGAGPMTASLGFALIYDGPIDITAVDASRAALQDGKRLMKEVRPDVRVKLIDGNLRDGRLRQHLGQDYDLILCSNVLNEFPEAVRRERDRPSAALKLVSDLLTRRLSSHGRVLLVEPASRSASNVLIRLRDRLVAEERGQILGPCVGTDRCPLGGAKARNWCHSELPWRRPRLVEDCDRLLGHRRDRLKWSWLLLSPPSTPCTAHRDSVYRVIGGVMGDNPRKRYLCGNRGRVTAVQTRERHSVWQAWRGELTEISSRVQTAPWGERLIKVQDKGRGQ